MALNPAVSLGQLIFSPVGMPFPVIRIDDLSIEPGNIVTILGRSGCGKSTFLSLLAGLNRPEADGFITIYGKSSTTAAQLGYIAMSFQSPILMSWRTALDNIRLAFDLKGTIDVASAAEKALEYVQLARYRDFYPNALSSGMKSRIAVAQAMVSGAKLLLMDEVFGTLDESTRVDMNLMLRDLNKFQMSSTIVFVTHSIDEAVLLGDRVLVFRKIRNGHDGSLVCDVAIDIERRTRDTRYTKDFNSYKRTLEDVLQGEPG